MKHAMVGMVLAAMVGAAGSATEDETLRQQASTLFGRIEATKYQATPEAELGRALFWDARLSLDGKTSCGSCHFARDWGADARRFSPDARGALTSRHSPTVFYSMSQPALRWLGDRKSGADQAESSMSGSMGLPSKEAAVEKLTQLSYQAAFRAAYPQEAEPLNSRNFVFLGDREAPTSIFSEPVSSQ